ncbi:hypothetical protein [Cronobacter malonaticus]|uniref:hypothetical protein n=1 Tax=Cronobacter malonaticus TaxID=413503 RepID=UPI001375BBF2|nr:hypothetical protein [Cronobacter malonaticus]NCH53045.1 hypothetical protein [Cronobacter malonaticus]
MRKTVWAATLLALTPISYGYATIASTSAAMTASIAAANAASQQAQNSVTQTSAVSAPIIQSSKLNPGFATCGKRTNESVGSLGCVISERSKRKEVPWRQSPGYVLGNTLPASYDVNAVSFDHYNGVATVYFSY